MPFSPRARYYLMALLLAATSLCANAQNAPKPGDITVTFIDTNDQELPLHALDAGRAYLQTEPGQAFAIRIRNNSRSRAGVVVAVDGFNALSLAPSSLSSDEAMYLIGGKKTRTFRGWRVGGNRARQFTASPGSGAERWPGQPGPGRISVALFADRQPLKKHSGRLPAPIASAAKIKQNLPAHRVFRPRSRPLANYEIQYQSYQQLCQRRVLRCAPERRLSSDDLSIDIIDDRGRRFPQFPLDPRPNNYRAYLQAQPNANYSIEMHNHSDEQIAVVVAVDGRNIISGKRSELSPSERMYVLAPGERTIYKGWRTSKNVVNEFYFTDVSDSYAEAWGDRSASGVIAIAAFQSLGNTARDQRIRHQGRSKSDQTGTGFGDERYSPSRQVEFTAYREPFGRYFIKYEWRDSLCRKRVINCGDQRPSGNNNSDYAPKPDRVRAATWARQYAETAVAQYRESQRRGCRLRGPRWNDNYEAHYRWALGVDRARSQREIDLRKAGLATCRR